MIQLFKAGIGAEPDYKRVLYELKDGEKKFFQLAQM